ncbi:hypothetical protein Tco_1282589 [Tanacetum coccineum]
MDFRGRLLSFSGGSELMMRDEVMLSDGKYVLHDGNVIGGNLSEWRSWILAFFNQHTSNILTRDVFCFRASDSCTPSFAERHTAPSSDQNQHSAQTLCEQSLSIQYNLHFRVGFCKAVYGGTTPTEAVARTVVPEVAWSPALKANDGIGICPLGSWVVVVTVVVVIVVAVVVVIVIAVVVVVICSCRPAPTVLGQVAKLLAVSASMLVLQRYRNV